MRILIVLVISAVLVSCKKEGCTNEAAVNYNASAQVDDGSCQLEQLNNGIPFFYCMIDGVPFNTTQLSTLLHYDFNSSAAIFDIQGGDFSGVFEGPQVLIRLTWTGYNEALDHPLENIEIWKVEFGDGNNYYQNATVNCSVQFTSVDTVNRLVSGTFEAQNFEDNDSTAYHYLTNGVFANISY